MPEKTGRQEGGSSPEGGGPRIGQKISHYEIREKIGQGGMGEVFLAYDTSLDRRVALKFLPSSVAGDSTEKKRFLRGAKSAAALDHPYICSIYAVGEAEGQSFIAMEFIRGETLQQLLAGGRLPFKESLRLASEIAEALAAAHAEDIVHRDLKPSNIMLAVGGHVKVLDFGLAKRVAALGGGDSQYETASRLTGEGSTLGTLAYMSPEQVRGQEVGPQSDIFSFGVVLYEMLTGVHPFQKSTSIDTAAAILNLTPPPISRYWNEASELLEHIVRKMLVKDAAERYQLVHEVRTDLAHVPEVPAAREASVPESPPAPAEAARASGGAAIRLPSRERLRTWRLPAWATRRSLYAFLASAVGLVLVAALWAWWPSSPTVPVVEASSVAVLPLTNLSEDPLESEYLAEGISRAVGARLARAGLRVSPWDSVLQYKGSRKPADRIARELNVDAVLTGTFKLADDRLLTAVSLVRAESGLENWAEAIEEKYEDLFQAEQRIASGAASHLKTALSDEEAEALAWPGARSLDAYEFYLQGAHFVQEGSRDATRVAFQYLARAVELDPGLAEAHAGLGAVYSTWYYNGWEGGFENLDRAEASFETALRLRPSSMRARRGLVQLNWERGLSEACLAQGREAARAGREDDVETLLARAEAYHYGGLAERAIPLYRRIIELEPVNEAAHWQLVVATFWAGNFTETVEAGNRYFRRLGSDGQVHTYVGLSHQLLSDDRRAREQYEKAIQLGAASGDQGPVAPSSIAETLVYAGLLYDRLAERGRAEEAWRQGVRIVKPRVEDHPNNVKLRLYLACFYGLLNERDAFLTEKARALKTALLNPFEIQLLAAVHAKRGETEPAVELLRRSLQHGRVDPTWKVILRAASVSLLQPGLESFGRELEAKQRELSRRY